MTALDLDPQFIQALRLLHSTNKESIDQLRSLLDEAIKQKYGSSKMLSNTLKKYAIEEIVLSDQSSSSRKSKSSNSSKHSKSSKNNSPITIRETTPDPLQSDDNLADILEDVACIICKGMDVGARNRLVECVKCGSLYHQECHTPHISDSQIDTQPVEWYCCNCKIQPAPKERNSPKIIETKSKESSRRSSSSSSKHADKYKSSSSNQSQTSNGSSSSSSKIVPTINIVSQADKRLKDMMKKAKQDKRGRSNNSGSSKHSNSSSSKSSHDKSNSHRNKSDG